MWGDITLLSDEDLQKKAEEIIAERDRRDEEKARLKVERARDSFGVAVMCECCTGTGDALDGEGDPTVCRDCDGYGYVWGVRFALIDRAEREHGCLDYAAQLVKGNV